VELKTTPIDVLLLDIQLKADDEGLRKIPEFLSIDPELSIVMLSGISSFETVRDAMRAGADDYVRKDLVSEDLLLTLSRVTARKALVQAKRQSAYEVSSQQQRNVLIGESPAIEALRKQIERARNTQANVLITGETGVGKEVVARLLRRELDGELEPFVAVDSATIQSTMAESILFGHERGAFTGADRMKKGVFEEANRGTVYFDEIANMPLEIQAKLLRVIQEKEITRLGSAKVIPLSFRVIAATNVSLEELAKKGGFKTDLLQRLSVLPIFVAPLRERPDDVTALVEHFRNREPQARRLNFRPETLKVLENYPWPGNVRELGNLIAYLGVMNEQDEVYPEHLPHKILKHSQKAPETALWDPAAEISFYEKMSRVERELLTDELKRAEGNVSRMATKLGIDRSHLYSKLRAHKLNPNDVRHPNPQVV
jgi:DNA-binding NtrC family response regulator